MNGENARARDWGGFVAKISGLLPRPAPDPVAERAAIEQIERAARTTLGSGRRHPGIAGSLHDIQRARRSTSR